MVGKVRVGKCLYKNGKRIDPEYPEFTKIVCLTKSTEYGDLGPYCLKDDKDRLMENIWQFSKIYPKISKNKEKYSRYDSRIIWEWDKDTTFIKKDIIKEDIITEDYYIWRKKGMNSKDPIRYPVGYNNMSSCVGVLLEAEKYDIKNALGYVESRKKLYGPLYIDLVKKQKRFNELKKRLNNGENLLICEVDVAFQDGMTYYKEKFGVDNNFIENNTMEINQKNFDIVLNDSKYRCGHGYFLAAALLDLEIK